ncbi:MAG: hypothetical protein M1820_002527 [Bogoriella megaspora]|nr:MAG: hypothetical protein M1820_002527 [Bogoriella megaspora]
MQHATTNSLKRPFQSTEEEPASKRQRHGGKVMKHHSLRYRQPSDIETTLVQQDSVFIQSQLLRAITVACGAVGYDAIQATALESFRAIVEEYMIKFLSLVHGSMGSSRRVQPLPQDFIYALASTNMSPAWLQEHLTLSDRDSDSSPLAPSNLQPHIRGPSPAESPPPDLTSVLGPDLIAAGTEQERYHIPRHFPQLPSQHTWRSTPIVAEREEDPRKIRERATDEGIQAERALRRLRAARNAGTAEQNRLTTSKGPKCQEAEDIYKQTLNAMLKEDELADGKTNRRADPDNMEIDLNFDSDETADEAGAKSKSSSSARKPDLEKGVMVNYEKRFWRKEALLNG